MSKSYYSLGLMSGTSMDGVDASIIQSDGETEYKVIIDKYFEYSQDIFKGLTRIRDKIKSSKDLKKFSIELENIEKEITLFHAIAVNEIIKKIKIKVDFIGFHGQTIYHDASQKISRQLGDGKLLSKFTNKTVIYDFRQNDLKNGGQGAPLTPVFHKLLVKENKINLPVTIINIGGIANKTVIDKEYLQSNDIGPGNCLIDEWVRKNSTLKYDTAGKIAQKGKINKKVLAYALEKINLNKPINLSYDLKDFDLSLFRNLSFEDGVATITEYTANMIQASINSMVDSGEILISGGGRKNDFLIYRIKNKINKEIKLIDNFGINGDFVESQAFAFLAIRSFLKLPISFPKTTGASKPCTGGVIVKY